MFNILVMVTEFEPDMIRMRTGEGLAVPSRNLVCIRDSDASTEP